LRNVTFSVSGIGHYRFEAAAISGLKIEGEAPKFEGTEFPSYFKRKDGSTSVEIELPQPPVEQTLSLVNSRSALA
jgi:hypothetical protein